MYAIKAMSKNGQVCAKEVVSGYVISIAFDDSCGKTRELERGNIRVYRGSYDATRDIFGDGVVPANIDNLTIAASWCRNH